LASTVAAISKSPKKAGHGTSETESEFHCMIGTSIKRLPARQNARPLSTSQTYRETSNQRLAQAQLFPSTYLFKEALIK
jgi:hypothetical protein